MNKDTSRERSHKFEREQCWDYSKEREEEIDIILHF